MAGPDGPVAGAGRPGRGAWLCASADCLDQAARRGTLARALRIERSAVDRHVEELAASLSLGAAHGPGE